MRLDAQGRSPWYTGSQPLVHRICSLCSHQKMGLQPLMTGAAASGARGCTWLHGAGIWRRAPLPSTTTTICVKRSLMQSFSRLWPYHCDVEHESESSTWREKTERVRGG
mgnify:CR=1 FL=1